MFSLYVHIPYCSRICPYCDFNVTAVEARPEARYTDAVVAEIERASQRPHWRGQSLETIYFGGGTPSLFQPESIGRILGCARALWPMSPGTEVTLEATPDGFTAERAARFREAGINRLSLGVQSTDTRWLRALGRAHSGEDCHAAVTAARRTGLDNVSVDLIFAIPGQTVEDWEAQLRVATDLGVEHVSAYGLTYEEQTPFFLWRARGLLVPAPEDLEASMFQRARDLLPAAGFEAYEISSFARPGRRSRHNQNYWNGTSYLGVGAGAHSFENEGWGRRTSNERNHLRFMEAVESRGGASVMAEDLTRGAALAEFAFLRLRQADGMDEGDFAARFGASLDESFPALRELCRDGLVEPTAGGYRLSRRGLLVADSVFALFL